MEMPHGKPINCSYQNVPITYTNPSYMNTLLGLMKCQANRLLHCHFSRIHWPDEMPWSQFWRLEIQNQPAHGLCLGSFSPAFGNRLGKAKALWLQLCFVANHGHNDVCCGYKPQMVQHLANCTLLVWQPFFDQPRLHQGSGNITQ